MRERNKIVEKFIVDDYTGSAALLVGLKKPGYVLSSIERKGKEVKVTYLRGVQGVVMGVVQGFYKNDETGETRFLPYTKKKVENQDGKWTRIPKPKPKSRADRRDDVVAEINKLKDSYESLADKLEGLVPFQPHRFLVWKEAIDQFKDLTQSPSEDFSDIEDLRSELEEWKDNLPENLQDSDKATQLEEAVSQLEQAQSELEHADWNISADLTLESQEGDVTEVIGELRRSADALGEAVSALEDVEFPGMFG